jgi:hypothetical protein
MTRAEANSSARGAHSPTSAATPLSTRLHRWMAFMCFASFGSAAEWQMPSAEDSSWPVTWMHRGESTSSWCNRCLVADL